MMKIELKITFRFEIFHRWVDAPIEYEYLSNLHRHVLHCTAWLQVSHDRELEFINLKNVAQSVCETQARLPYVKAWSCEKWARWIANKFDYDKVEVMEDGENGAVVTMEEDKKE